MDGAGDADSIGGVILARVSGNGGGNKAHGLGTAQIAQRGKGVCQRGEIAGDGVYALRGVKRRGRAGSRRGGGVGSLGRLRLVAYRIGKSGTGRRVANHIGSRGSAGRSIRKGGCAEAQAQSDDQKHR